MYSGTPSAPAPVTRNHGNKSDGQQQTRSIQRLPKRDLSQSTSDTRSSVRLHGHPAVCGCRITQDLAPDNQNPSLSLSLTLSLSAASCIVFASAYIPHPHTADGSAPRGWQRKARHQTQATQQIRRPAISTMRSATFPLSQRTRKKPRMTSTPHRLYIRLLASSPKPKKRCVIGVTMVWCRGRSALQRWVPQ